MIIDGQSNTLTLVTILQEIRYKPLKDVEVPVDATIPIQCFTLIREDRSIVIEHIISWKFEREIQRVFTRTIGFPMAKGRLRLILWLRKAEEEWTEMASYPLTVIQETVS
jgi:hypothetical protein